MDRFHGLCYRFSDVFLLIDFFCFYFLIALVFYFDRCVFD